MLSITEFNSLSPRQQARLVLDQGRYLHHIIRGWCKIDLYWFHNYYVEVWFLYDLKTIGLGTGSYQQGFTRPLSGNH